MACLLEFNIRAISQIGTKPHYTPEVWAGDALAAFLKKVR